MKMESSKKEGIFKCRLCQFEDVDNDQSMFF